MLTLIILVVIMIFFKDTIAMANISDDALLLFLGIMILSVTNELKSNK